jgi:hypothetical protein
MIEMEFAYKILVGISERKGPLGRCRRKRIWEDNIKGDLKEIKYMGVDRIHVLQFRGTCLALMNTAVKFRFP